MLLPVTNIWQPAVCLVSGLFYRSQCVSQSQQRTFGEASKASEAPNALSQPATHVSVAGVGASLTVHAVFIHILDTECGNISEILAMYQRKILGTSMFTVILFV
jgi:hypothetical protein